MKVVLATGIFPPEIGGPATYVANLARDLKDRGLQVSVIAYGEEKELRSKAPSNVDVTWISRKGGPFIRWKRYANALKRLGADADIVYAFSSVSCGVPLWLSKLEQPRKILRLGGDFLWERYTDRGGMLSLSEWYATNPHFKGMMNGLLRRFDYIVFSTRFQEELYEKSYDLLPVHGVIENALPFGVPVRHELHRPTRLLFMGRFVSFKNVGSMIIALKDVPNATLTIVGDGPLQGTLKALVKEKGLTDRVTFLTVRSGDAKQQLFLDHDLLVLPSYTEISPNTALEARAAGLPVLLSEETGLSRMLTDGTMLRRLRSPHDIATALRETIAAYEPLAERAAGPVPQRSWDSVADEHVTLFRNLL